MITWNAYIELFDQIINGQYREYPYDNPSYVHYTKMNESRQKRWMKRGDLLPELVEYLESIQSPQTWILITEPWCGDAAHSNPFIAQLAGVSELIDFKINLRDDEDSFIDDYLTNGGKSIPILVVRDHNGKDLFHWGPRPAACQALFLEHKNDPNKSAEEKKIELQNWYNENKGMALQQELLSAFRKAK